MAEYLMFTVVLMALFAAPSGVVLINTHFEMVRAFPAPVAAKIPAPVRQFSVADRRKQAADIAAMCIADGRSVAFAAQVKANFLGQFGIAP